MAAAARALEMMLGMTSSGIGHYDDLMNQIVWVDDGCLAQSDADVAAFKRADEGMNPMEEYELPTLLPKRRNDHVLFGSPEKKTKVDAAVGDGIILPCDAQMWCRKVFPFHVQHRLRKLARWRWNRLRDAIAFDGDFCLWRLFEWNNKEWWSPFVTDLNDRMDLASANMMMFYYYLCGPKEADWTDLMAFENGTVAWRDSRDEIWKSARSKWNALNLDGVFDGVCLPRLFA